MTRSAFPVRLLAILLFAGLALAQTGRLGPGDTVLDSGEYVDVYDYEGYAGEMLRISLVSDDFDPYLAVLGPDGSVVLEIDDSDGHGLDVATSLVLPAAGVYRIVVTSATAGEAGTYLLDVEGGPAAGEAAKPDQAPERPAPQPANGGGLPEGYYECYTTTSAGLWLSSIQSIQVGPGGRYHTVGETGEYRLGGDGHITFPSGFLAGRNAYLRESSGKPALAFPVKDNLVNGEPVLDLADTWCYYEPR